LYVRRNTHKPWADGGEVFDATIEVPVTIRNPDKPIGTHVFTAMARKDAGLRWTAVTIDNGDDDKDALDRITIPQDVLDRIAPTALPRSSIIVSDEPLSRETNYRTEFVAVLNNQPQGGFVTRRPTADVAVANGNFWGDDGSGSLFQPNWNSQTGNTRRRGGLYYYQVQRGWW
ncbi:MAG: L,D-transpeptidase, partial [Bradyrhizobium sp.]